MSSQMAEAIREAYRRKALGDDDEIVRSLDAWEGPFEVEVNGKKQLDAFIAWLYATYRTMRLIDTSLPPGLPEAPARSGADRHVLRVFRRGLRHRSGRGSGSDSGEDERGWRRRWRRSKRSSISRSTWQTACSVVRF